MAKAPRRRVTAVLVWAMMAVPGPLLAQSNGTERRLCLGDGPPSECAAWALTDMSWGRVLWGGDRDSPLGDNVLLWEYGLAANLTERSSLGASVLFLGGRLADEGIGALARYRYRLSPLYALDLAGGVTSQSEQRIVRLNFQAGIRAYDVFGLGYVGRSDRWGGAGYGAARLHGKVGLVVGAGLGLLYLLIPET